MIPVVWVSFDETPARCRWDADVVDVICPRDQFQHYGEGEPVPLPNVDGTIIVFSCGGNEQYIPKLNLLLSKFEWIVLLLISDETGTFPWREITHPNIRIWIQSPRPDLHPPKFNLRYLPLGCPTYDNTEFSEITAPPQSGVYFEGQLTHARRDEMAAAFPEAIKTPGFTLGSARSDYLKRLSSSIVAPCPSGPCTPETFRFWEALEMGAVPIVDTGPIPDEQGRAAANYPADFWPLLLGPSAPLPVVEEWSQAPTMAQNFIDAYPEGNNAMSAWYQLHKRILRQRFLWDVEEVSGIRSDAQLTCLVPTSSTPNNPDTSHIDAVIASIRNYTSAEILVMIDGIGDHQSHLRDNYNEYIRRVLWKCGHVWESVVPVLFTESLHQSGKLIRTLPLVTTPLILWNEHDTPLEGDIPHWDECMTELLEDRLDVIRFYHEAAPHPEHAHLMLDMYNPFLLKTIQQSGRPHLARTDYYRRVMADHFSPDSRTFIEWTLHSVCQCVDIEPWERHRMALYAPLEGTWVRSGHLDARGSEPTYEELAIP